MALHKFNEWQVDLKFYKSAKTSAAHRHAPISMVCLAVVFLDEDEMLLTIKTPTSSDDRRVPRTD